MCKISVVVPVYNVKEYIDDCLESLVQQTLSDIDIILVDDGSTDGSGVICDEYSLKYNSVRVIHKTNGGLGSARNVGLEAAIGKYVYFIDGDDSLKKNALEKLFELAEEKSLDVILFSAECFSDGLGINYNANEYKRTKYLREIMTGKDLFLGLFQEHEYYASIPLRLYRTEYLQEKSYRFPETIIHEDEIYAYWSLIQAQRAICIGDRFYNRRFRAGSIMTSKKAYDSSVGYIYTWKEVIKSLDELSDWEIDDIGKAIEFANSRLSIAIGLYAEAFDRNERDSLKPCIKEIQALIDSSNKKLIRSKSEWLFLTNPNIYRFLIRLYSMKSSMKNRWLEYLEIFELYSELLKIKGIHRKKGCVAILIGTPTHGNLGDQAIVLAEKKMLSKIDNIGGVVEISSKNYLRNPDLIQSFVDHNDLVIIDGGGSMGTLWVNNEYRFRDVVSRFHNNNIYIFPQTIYYGDEGWEQHVLKESKVVYSRHNKLTIFCRDYSSYFFAQRMFINNEVIYVPDIVLSLYPWKTDCNRQNKVLVCFRDDIESTGSNQVKVGILKKVDELAAKVEKTSTLTGGYINKCNRQNELRGKLEEFSSAKLVITDRLHAMIFCALTGTPCLAIDNVSKKVSGTYEWIKELSYIKMISTNDSTEDIDLYKLIENADHFSDHLQIADKYIEMREIIRNAKGTN